MGGRRVATGRVRDAAVVVALAVLAAVLRVRPLGPSSLWLDDAWVALVVRTDALLELRLVGASAPGFVALLKVWLGSVGFSEVAAQAIPLAAGVAAPPSLFVVARRLGWQRGAAGLGATVLACSPVAVVYSTRVKQYTLESVVAIGMVALGAWVLAAPRDRRRWSVLVVAGAVAMVVSAFLAVHVAAVTAAGLVLGWRRRDPAVAGLAAITAGAFGLVAAAWYALVLVPALPATLTTFWSGAFIDLRHGPAAAWDSAVGAASGVAGGLSPLPTVVVVGAVAVGLLAVAVRRPPLAVLLATPTAVALVLAALERAPLGGGRTDSYLYPTFALAVAGGADALLGSLRRWWRPVVTVAATVAVLATASVATPYPAQDVRPLAAEADGRQAGSALLLYPATMWAYALYTSDEVEIERSATSTWGFAPRFGSEATFALPPGRDDPAAYGPTVAQVAARYDEVWLLASHQASDYADLHRQLADAGFGLVEVRQRAGAELTRWHIADRGRTG